MVANVQDRYHFQKTLNLIVDEENKELLEQAGFQGFWKMQITKSIILATKFGPKLVKLRSFNIFSPSGSYFVRK